MSITLTSEQVSEELEEKIINEVQVKKLDGSNKFGFGGFGKQKEIIVRPFKMNDVSNTVSVPFRWALDNIPHCQRPSRDTFSLIDTKFTTTLRSVQKEIKEECISYLNKKGCVLISLYPGAGKTCLSIYLASKIGLKTLIVCHRLVLMEQWKKAIERFIECPRIGIVKPEKKTEKLLHMIENNDFLLINAQNVKKIGKDYFNKVGLVIIDEIHAILAESLSECLYHIHPRYMIGLSATPNRPDGLDKLLDFYFGTDTKISRELYHPHIVYRIDTSIEYEEDSKTQWSAMITSQCMNESRNNLIVRIIRECKDRCFLVLCKRVDQAKYIASMLMLEDEKVSVMTEGVNDFDENSRIIVSSIQKTGVGFSFDKLDALILASDVEEYFIQYLARVMRTEQVKPIVFDLVDAHRSLKKHFSERKKVYLKAGGVIKDFYKEFPMFTSLEM
jgi:superfamily II DNA or RNA helicase